LTITQCRVLAVDRNMSKPAFLFFQVACLLALWLGAFGLAAAAGLEYLYINASEGRASGGHAALRLGDEVYHFQHVPPGLLRIKREDFARFRQLYADKENRSIHVHQIESTAETQTRLRDYFNHRRLIEDGQFDRRDALVEDRRLLQALLDQAEGRPSAESDDLEVKGLGLFAPEGSISANSPDPRLARLAAKLEAAYSSDFIARKSREMRRALRDLEPEIYDPQRIALGEDRFVPPSDSFAERYGQQVSALAALRVLAQARPLADAALLRPEGAEFRLDDAEWAKLSAYREKLEVQLVELMRSGSSDWGFALLVGMARLIALDESLASGRWVVLDLRQSPPAEEDAPLDAELIRASHEWIRSRWASARAELARPALDEWAYVRLEQGVNLLHESALRTGGNPRIDAMSLSPSRPGRFGLVATAMDSPALKAHLARLDIYRQAYESRLEALYAYDLIGRNCASEIFRAIDRALGEGADGQAESESERRLGGHVSGQSLAFIPFLSYRYVEGRWNVRRSEVLPSYRLRRLGQAKAEENPLWVELRESNVLSARLYHWHPDDGAFLFFTDDTPWIRPVAGGFNLATGLAQGVLGVFTAPWDGGENLSQGASGALFSLPELVFFNIRKGSFPSLGSMLD